MRKSQKFGLTPLGIMHKALDTPLLKQDWVLRVHRLLPQCLVWFEVRSKSSVASGFFLLIPRHAKYTGILQPVDCTRHDWQSDSYSIMKWSGYLLDGRYVFFHTLPQKRATLLYITTEYLRKSCEVVSWVHCPANKGQQFIKMIKPFQSYPISSC